MSSGITKQEADMQYLKGNLKIDVGKMTRTQVLKSLRDDHQMNTTSWVLDTLAEHYGTTVESMRAEYLSLVKHMICGHGFIGSCPYCKYGTD